MFLSAHFLEQETREESTIDVMKEKLVCSSVGEQHLCTKYGGGRNTRSVATIDIDLRGNNIMSLLPSTLVFLALLWMQKIVFIKQKLLTKKCRLGGFVIQKSLLLRLCRKTCSPHLFKLFGY